MRKFIMFVLTNRDLIPKLYEKNFIYRNDAIPFFGYGARFPG